MFKSTRKLEVKIDYLERTHLIDALRLLLFAWVNIIQNLALFARHDHVLVAVLALFGRPVSPRLGVHHVSDQVPVGDVGGGRRGQIQR